MQEKKRSKLRIEERRARLAEAAPIADGNLRRRLHETEAVQPPSVDRNRKRAASSLRGPEARDPESDALICRLLPPVWPLPGALLFRRDGRTGQEISRTRRCRCEARPLGYRGESAITR